MQAQPGALAPNARAADVAPLAGTATNAPQAPSAAIAPVAPTADNLSQVGADQAWRYVQHGNRWWYWSPDSQWMLYDQRGWSPFQTPAATALETRAAPQAANPWREPRGALGEQYQAGRLPLAPGATDLGESWRYVQHGGSLWYYTPQNTWMIQGPNGWTDYRAPQDYNATRPVQ